MAEINDTLPIGNNTQTDTGRINGEGESVDNIISGGNYAGSMQQILSKNTGNRVIVDFLVGTSNIVRKEGILYLVGISYIVLFDDRSDTYTVCNLYSIEFVTFITPGSNAATTVSRSALKRV